MATKRGKQLTDEQKGDPASYCVADRLVQAGRLGQKSGAGYYRYDPETRQRIADPDVDAIIDSCRQELGIAARAVSDEEIVDRLILALANEGARILEEGIAQRASDIDVVVLLRLRLSSAPGRTHALCAGARPRLGREKNDRVPTKS